MARNVYFTDLDCSDIATYFMKSQSEALAQNISGTADYAGIMQATKEQCVINENTQSPELFASNILFSRSFQVDSFTSWGAICPLTKTAESYTG
jgi:hypothetical protein